MSTRSGLLSVLFTCLLIAVLTCLTPVSAQDETDSDEVTSAETAETESPAAASGDPAALQLLADVRQKLAEYDSVQCELHEVVVMAGQRFQAIGRYTQGTDLRYRLEFRVFPVRATRNDDVEADKLENATSAGPADTDAQGVLIQVSDGNVLWSHWDLGENHQVTRRNLREIIQAASDVPPELRSDVLTGIGTGGLGALMASLTASMEFGKVRDEAVGEQSYKVVLGRWNRAALATMTGTDDPAQQQLPEHIPDYVRVYFDAATLFPRRIQYLKQFPDPSQDRIRPLVTLDLRKVVLNGDLGGETFEFVPPDDVTETDVTGDLVGQIKSLAERYQEATSGAGRVQSAVNPNK